MPDRTGRAGRPASRQPNYRYASFCVNYKVAESIGMADCAFEICTQPKQTKQTKHPKRETAPVLLHSDQVEVPMRVTVNLRLLVLGIALAPLWPVPWSAQPRAAAAGEKASGNDLPAIPSLEAWLVAARADDPRERMAAVQWIAVHKPDPAVAVPGHTAAGRPGASAEALEPQVGAIAFHRGTRRDRRWAAGDRAAHPGLRRRARPGRPGKRA